MIPVMDFLRYIANPSSRFPREQFDVCLQEARDRGYVSVQSKGQVMLTPAGRELLMGPKR